MVGTKPNNAWTPHHWFVTGNILINLDESMSVLAAFVTWHFREKVANQSSFRFCFRLVLPYRSNLAYSDQPDERSRYCSYEHHDQEGRTQNEGYQCRG